MLRDGKGDAVCAKAEEEKDAVDATVTMLFVVVRFIVIIFETEVVVALLAAMWRKES